MYDTCNKYAITIRITRTHNYIIESSYCNSNNIIAYSYC